jgi:hypothetical protein
MPTCGQVFARRGVVVGAPDAGSVDFDECVDGVAPIGHLVAVIVDLPSSALWAVPLTVAVAVSAVLKKLVKVSRYSVPAATRAPTSW